MSSTAINAAPVAESTAPDDDDDEVQPLVFPTGLVGCESWRRFVLLTDNEEDLPVAYLQSLDETSVRLLITDPRLVVESYTVSLSHEERQSLGLRHRERPVLYCTLTISPDGLITANLLGPLVVNPRTGVGRQVVLADSVYSTRHPVARLQG